MVSLLDIGPLTEEVPIRGNPIAVMGVSAGGIVPILSRFPEIRMLLGGKAADITPDMLIGMAPELVAAVIAAGCGSPGDKKAEEVAGRLGVEEQLDLLVPILRMTFPQGIRPFVDKLYALMPDAEAAVSGWEAATKSPEPSKT